MSSLLTYDQAVQVIRKACRPPEGVFKIRLGSAAGYALAEPVIASEPNPRFDNSAVDGYAIGCSADAISGAELRIQGSVAAGETTAGVIQPGHAVRILTGAPVPPGVFGIAMQEDVKASDAGIVLQATIREGDAIRHRGADFAAGQQLVDVGTCITPGVATQLAFVGMMQVPVFRYPRVRVITTGDELVSPEVCPAGSQIRDTNSVMLKFQVRNSIRCQGHFERVVDSAKLLRDVLARVALVKDVILVAGGASVGDRDYLASTVQELGQIHFHGVSIRPGKPMLFGQIGSSLVFGLPGNPASAFVCFEIFVKEALRRLAGWAESELSWTGAIAGFEHRAVGREDFLRVKVNAGVATLAADQGSSGIASLAAAQALARFPANRDIHQGDPVSVLRLL